MKHFFFLLFVGWNLDVMAGAQAAVLDIKQKLQFEDGKSNKIDGTRVPNDNGDAMPT